MPVSCAVVSLPSFCNHVCPSEKTERICPSIDLLLPSSQRNCCPEMHRRCPQISVPNSSVLNKCSETMQKNPASCKGSSQTLLLHGHTRADTARDPGRSVTPCLCMLLHPSLFQQQKHAPLLPPVLK